MNFIRFGSEVLNIDSIKRVEFVEDKSVVIYFSLATPKDFIIYKGKDARLLRRFFEDHTPDITASPVEFVAPKVARPNGKTPRKRSKPEKNKLTEPQPE
jgi:hypothetical protein